MRPIFLFYNGVDGRTQRFLRLGTVFAEMGDELDGLGAGALSDRSRCRSTSSSARCR
jgi:hypothetical protein